MKTKIITWIILFLLSFNSLLALGISPAKTTINSEETKSYAGEFLVINNDLEDMDLTISTQGELAQYITLKTKEISLHREGGTGTIYYTLTLPDKIPPGETLGAIIVQQKPSAANENTVSSQLVLYHKIILLGPYPDKYVITKLNFHESGNTIRFVSEVENKGKKNIDTIKTIFYVNDKEQQQQVLETQPTSLAVHDDKLLDTTIDKNKFVPGQFEVLAITTYDGQKTEVIKKLQIGKPEIDITYFDKYFTSNEVNKYSLDLLNKWNQQIENIFVDITVKKDNTQIDQFRTKSVDLDAQTTKRINDYFDAKNKNPGSYTFDMVVNFWNNYRMETKTFKSELLPKEKISAIEHNVPEETITGKAIENDSSTKEIEPKSIDAKTGIIIGLLLFISIILVIILIIVRQKKENKEQDQL